MTDADRILVLEQRLQEAEARIVELSAALADLAAAMRHGHESISMLTETVMSLHRRLSALVRPAINDQSNSIQ
jgi:uncharacterized coiled-coil protein SlyX